MVGAAPGPVTLATSLAWSLFVYLIMSKKSIPKPAQSKVESELSTVAQFEQSLDELEHLVSKMETGELNLEQSLVSYERGVNLYRQCQQALEHAQLRINVLADPLQPENAQPFVLNDEHGKLISSLAATYRTATGSGFAT